MLCGQVRAINPDGAVEKTEVLIKQVIAGAIATGLAVLCERTMGPPGNMVLSLEPNDAGEQWHVRAELDELSRRTFFDVPGDTSDFERYLMAQELGQPFTRRLVCLRALLTGTSERAKELRNAACLLVDSLAVREPGMSILLSFLSMEAVLLEKKDTESLVARLTEAVAYRLGRTASERRELRKTIKNLYNTRSQFVHTGTIAGDDARQRSTASDLARRILSREIDDLQLMEEA